MNRRWRNVSKAKREKKVHINEFIAAEQKFIEIQNHHKLYSAFFFGFINRYYLQKCHLICIQIHK